MRIHFLNTVWSDITLLEHEGHYAFVDTGMAYQYPMIREYLDNMGIKKIDFILLTHFHRDHYGCIPDLLLDYSVGTVYLKEYGGKDNHTAWGSPADDEYRNNEYDKYYALQNLIRERSTLVQIEDIDSLDFCGFPIRLYSTKNTIQYIFDDASCPETYHKYLFSENQNSCVAVMKSYGVNTFFGGDMMDAPCAHPLANFVNTRVSKEIGEQMHIYKAPHHGTKNTASPEALAIYRPQVAVFTNGEGFLVPDHTDAIENMKNANPDVQIYSTEHQHVIVTVNEDGSIGQECIHVEQPIQR